MSFFENTRRPEGLGGRLMVGLMNFGHRALAAWGLRFLEIPTNAEVLDCGCGGGANMAKLLKMCPEGSVRGIDYSTVSVEKARRVNRRAVGQGRCEALRASAEELPFVEGRFDLVTAFETVYFWQDLSRCFWEVCRVLKPGGIFFICNECGGSAGRNVRWPEMIAGMTVYSGPQLRAAMERAGFCGVRLYENKKGWVCAVGRKK